MEIMELISPPTPKKYAFLRPEPDDEFDPDFEPEPDDDDYHDF